MADCVKQKLRVHTYFQQYTPNGKYIPQETKGRVHSGNAWHKVVQSLSSCLNPQRLNYVKPIFNRASYEFEAFRALWG